MTEENSYEYQCMRAELLGLEKPDKQKFDLEQQALREKELQDDEIAEGLTIEGEKCEGTKGKLDELNTLLTRTQQKINTFTGSPVKTLTRMFSKTKIEESISIDEQSKGRSVENEVNVNETTNRFPNINKQEIPSTSIVDNSTEECKSRSLEIDKKMTSHLDKLDELINKAEKADLSMSHQNKQMKKFIKK